MTELCFFSDVARLARSDTQLLPVQATYSFVLMGLVPWMGFGNRAGKTVTRGLISRAQPEHKLDTAGWERLAALFPDEIVTPMAARR